jgi:hypothetical protein
MASSDMDWTSSTDFDSAFQGDGYGMQHHDNGMGSMDFRSTQSLQADNQPPANEPPGPSRGGVGRLVAQFENKNFSPALPPRPTSNAVASPIAINQQYQTPSFDQQPLSPFSFDTRHHPNSYASNSFQSQRFDSPSDSHFGSYGNPQSRVTSPVATSPGPVPFGSFHDASHMASPVAGPTSDPFGSIDFMTGTRAPSTIPRSPMPDSPMPTTPATSVPGGTPGFAIWRPPEQQVSQQFTQHIQQKRPSTFQLQPSPKTRQPGRMNVDAETLDTKPRSHPAGFLRPAIPTTPKPALNNGNQFILELNPGSKAKGKAPPKPPKPRAPKPSNVSLGSGVKQEPMSPAILEPPTPQGAGTVRLLDSLFHQQKLTLSFQDNDASTPNAANASRQAREQVPAQAWEGFKSTIRDLYLEQRKPLKEVMSIMAEKYNFQAT